MLDIQPFCRALGIAEFRANRPLSSCTASSYLHTQVLSLNQLDRAHLDRPELGEAKPRSVQRRSRSRCNGFSACDLFSYAVLRKRHIRFHQQVRPASGQDFTFPFQSAYRSSFIKLRNRLNRFSSWSCTKSNILMCCDVESQVFCNIPYTNNAIFARAQARYAQGILNVYQGSG